VRGVQARRAAFSRSQARKLAAIDDPDMNLNDPIDTPFPASKISAVFLEFAQPILGEEGSLTAKQIEQILRVAFVTWNAVVYDTVHANTE
jgi:hypothetical protein